jgi:tetratricopeptide (TPR) repeat protein
MLYLILPPVIIIIALIALVYFFSQRFPRVEQEIAAQLSHPEASHKQGSHFFGSVKRFLLSVLEHLAQWFKVFALRSYNMLHAWTQSLREKKNKAVVKPLRKLPPEVIPEEKPIVQQRPAPLPEQPIRPMVSQKVTKPEEKKVAPPVVVPPTPAPVIKNQLEDILVERIASNPRDLEAYERLGEYYMEQGNLQDAKECYRQVLRLSPVHRLAKIKIRRLEKLLEQK